MKSLTVPAYLEAKTKDELRQLMADLQLTLGLKIVFSTPQFAQSKWVTWYEIPLAFEVEVTNGQKKA